MQLKIVRFVPESNGRRGQLNTGAVALNQSPAVQSPVAKSQRSKMNRLAIQDAIQVNARCSPGPPAAISAPASLLQRRHVDHEPVFHVALQKALERFIDLVDPDHFDVRRHTVRGAEIEHLLRFGNASNNRSGQPAPAKQASAVRPPTSSCRRVSEGRDRRSSHARPKQCPE